MPRGLKTFACVPYLPGPCVALLSECHVANALVVWIRLEITAICDVVEVLDILGTHSFK